MQKSFTYSLINNLFILYCVLFQHFDFYGLLFLFYLDIAISVPFIIGLAERLPINKNLDNDLKFTGSLAYWDERKYRGKMEYFYTLGNLMLLAIVYVFLMAVPLFIIPDNEKAKLTVDTLFPFRSNWFLGCVLAILIQHAGNFIYNLKIKDKKDLFFEDVLKFDYFKYWLLIVFILIGFVAIGFIQSQIKYNSYMGLIIFSSLYFITKTILDYRSFTGKNKEVEIEI
jgi:hypothetical protein